MSRQTARTILDQFNSRPALIAPRYGGTTDLGNAEVSAVGLLGDVREIAQADVETLEARASVRRRELASAYGYEDSTPAKPFVFADGKAIIPIHGILINRFPYSWGFATGYAFIRAQVEAASNDPDVDGIVYDVNSYGGLVSGCQETSDIMWAASKAGGGKPSLAVVDANCYSAAYMLASAADRLVVTPSGGAGSIGVVLMHMDMSKMLDDIGIKVTFIHAGDHKVDGNPYQPLSDGVTSELQSEIDKLYDKFVGTVVRNRPQLSDEAVRGTQARCYQADDALALDLIDAVQTPPDALDSYFNAEEAGEENEQPESPVGPDNDTEPSQSAKDNTMPGPNDKPAVPVAATGPSADEAAASARIAERERISAILALPEAEGRSALASHLALTTDMTPDAAKGILNASPKAAAAPVAVAEPAKPEANHFQAAMNNGKHPNVGSGPVADEAAVGGEKPNRAAQILASQRKMTGEKDKPAA